MKGRSLRALRNAERSNVACSTSADERRSPSVTVKIQSASPVEVTANLHPGTDSATLVSEPLRADGFTAPPINAPEIAREPGAVRVTVKVGARQPKGRYRSVIRRKADESVAGDLTVVIS